MGGEKRETSCAVDGYCGFGAFRIVVAELEVSSFFGCFYGEQAVRADAAMAIAECGDGVLVEGSAEIAVVNNDEIIAGTVHFIKAE